MRPTVAQYEWTPYEGSLDRKKMSYEARVAYESFNSQKQKCRNPKNRWFKHYGGKGLSVHYGPREFIGWWLHSLKSFCGQTATVGRIDHDKGYSFDNISMQCMVDNSREAALRNNLVRFSFAASKPVVAKDKSGAVISTFVSIRDAARKLNVSQRLIHFLLSGRCKSSKKVPYILEMVVAQ